MAWAGGKRFDAGRPGGPIARIDGSGETGPSPVDALVSALAACTAVDVVGILEKRRTPPATLTIDAAADRAAGVPARVTRVRLDYQIEGPDVDRENAERAIELAITKYCSVRDSLDPAIPVEYALTLNGQAGAFRTA